MKLSPSSQAGLRLVNLAPRDKSALDMDCLAEIIARKQAEVDAYSFAQWGYERPKPASPPLYIQQIGRITRPRIDSAAWTGRQPRQSFRWWLYGVLWPSYACEECVGQDWWRGCYCAHYGALAPGGPGPGWLRRRGRHLWSWWFK